MWNGVGGKIKKGENDNECMIREIFEETGLEVDNPRYNGYITWTRNNEDKESIAIYTQLYSDERNWKIKETDEGILAWKKIEWVYENDNIGVINNIKDFLSFIIGSEQKYHFHYDYIENEIVASSKEII